MSMSGDLGEIDLDLISETSDIVGIGVEVKRGSDIFLPKMNIYDYPIFYRLNIN